MTQNNSRPGIDLLVCLGIAAAGTVTLTGACYLKNEGLVSSHGRYVLDVVQGLSAGADLISLLFAIHPSCELIKGAFGKRSGESRSNTLDPAN